MSVGRRVIGNNLLVPGFLMCTEYGLLAYANAGLNTKKIPVSSVNLIL